MKLAKSSFYLVIIACLIVVNDGDDSYQNSFETKKFTKTIDQMAADYEDDKNSMIAIAEKENFNMYDDFYEEVDNRIRIEQSLNMIYFGPPSSFLRLDSETILHILSHTRKHLIPTTRALLAWDVITDGKTAAFLQGREYFAFGSLLNVVPEEDLYYVNFGDPTVLKYFAVHAIKLDKRKFGVLVSAYRRYFGNSWYHNSTYINELGHLLCGFPPSDLEHISPKIFKELTVEALTRLTKCNANQTKTLYNIATHPDAYGEPFKWTSHEVYKLGSLFSCIPANKISAVQLEAITTISQKVLMSINQEKLGYFSKQQILRMNQRARRIYILRMLLKNSLDMSQLAKRNRAIKSPILLPTVPTLLFVSILYDCIYGYILSAPL